jgi:hypothetical protein
MSFNNLGTPVWLDAGAPPLQWWWGNGTNQGAQYAMANCLSPDAQMQIVNEANQQNDDSSVTYFVTFQNNGPEPCFHNINGGGLT